MTVARLETGNRVYRLAQSCQAGPCFPVVRRIRRQNADAPHPLALLCPRRKRPCGSRAAEQRDELAASHMPFKPWDRDIAPERYHMQTLRLIRICVLLGSDAIRCLIGMGLSAACAERKRAGRKEG